MRLLIACLSVLFIMAIFGVMLLNAQETVTVRLLWDDPNHDYEFTDIPLGVVLFGAAFAGFAFTGIVALVEGMKARLDRARLIRQVRQLQRELEALRNPKLDLPEEESQSEEATAGTASAGLSPD